MDIPLIEQVKIQAQVLVPLVKTLRAELGEERANTIVRKALAGLYRKFGEKCWRGQGGRDLGETMASAWDAFAAGDALDYEVLRKTPDSFDTNVTGCRYAKFYKEIGAPELGFLLVCNADFSMAEGFGPDVQLARTQTIMQGASHCDFRYALKKGNNGSETE
jgi:L-2-amino-thiazoline-4-carboxylic acid hydrolase